MAFQFILDPVLRLRRSIERQRMLAFQDAALQLGRSQETVARLDKFLADSEAVDAARLSAGATGAELQFAALLRQQMQQLCARLHHEVRRLESARQQAAEAYEHAFHVREILDSLRARQRRLYQIEQARREQQRLDAAYLLQRWHHGSG